MDKIETCKKCSKKRLDRDKGIVCGLTNEKPTFVGSCDYFTLDEKIEKQNNATTSQIRPNKKRAEVAQIFIWIILGLDVVSIISSYFQYELLSLANNGGFISDSAADLNDNREMIIGIIYMIVSVVSGITFIQWFRRAYYNLNARTSCSHSEGWAAGSWFVPIISLFRPYQIMKEMWIGTSHIIKTKTDTIIENDGTVILGLWWTLWIISNYVGNYVLKSTIKGETVADYMNSTIGDIVLSVMGIPLAYVTIRIIKLYAHKEEQLYLIEKN